MKTSLGQFGLALMVLTACVPESSRDTARPDTSSTQLPAEEPAETRDPALTVRRDPWAKRLAEHICGVIR